MAVRAICKPSADLGVGCCLNQVTERHPHRTLSADPASARSHSEHEPHDNDGGYRRGDETDRRTPVVTGPRHRLYEQDGRRDQESERDDDNVPIPEVEAGPSSDSSMSMELVSAAAPHSTTNEPNPRSIRTTRCHVPVMRFRP